jgi:hypothetical protein
MYKKSEYKNAAEIVTPVAYRTHLAFANRSSGAPDARDPAACCHVRPAPFALPLPVVVALPLPVVRGGPSPCQHLPTPFPPLPPLPRALSAALEKDEPNKPYEQGDRADGPLFKWVKTFLDANQANWAHRLGLNPACQLPLRV